MTTNLLEEDHRHLLEEEDRRHLLEEQAVEEDLAGLVVVECDNL